MDPDQETRTTYGRQFMRLGLEIGNGFLAISERHPHDQPHFYLMVLGASRPSQGKGFGSAMLREVLDRCDRQGFGAYLESSNVRNVPLYERHGFEC